MAVGQSGSVQVTIRIDGQNTAGAAITQAGSQIDRLNDRIAGQLQASSSIEVATSRLKQLGGVAGDVVQRIGFLKLGFDAVADTVGAVGQVVEEGAKAADQFDVLSASIEGFEGMVSRAKSATSGMFSERDITRAIGTFNSFGISLDEVDRVLEQVAKTSVRTGEDSGYLLQSITTGIARLSPAILDNLQLQVTQAEISERAAAATGKNTDALSKNEKQAAALAIVLEQLERNNVKVDLTNSRTAAVKRLSNAWDDLKTSVGGFLADATVGVIDWFGDAFDGMNSLERAAFDLSNALPEHMRSMRVKAEGELSALNTSFIVVSANAARMAAATSLLQAEASESSRLSGDLRQAEYIAKAQADTERQALRAARMIAERTGREFSQAEFDRKLAEINRRQVTATEEMTREAMTRFERAVAARKERNAQIEEEERRHQAELGQLAGEALAYLSPVEAQRADAEVRLKAAEDERAAARAANDLAGLRAANARVEASKQELAQLRAITEAERVRGGSGVGAASTKPTNIDLPGVRKIRYTPKFGAPSDELQLENLQTEAQLKIDAIRDQVFELSNLLLEDLDDTTSARVERALLTSRERILDIEHDTNVRRLRILNDGEQERTRVMEAEARRRAEIADREAERQLQVAGDMISGGAEAVTGGAAMQAISALGAAAGEIVGNWEQIQELKSGTLTAIGEVAAARIKGERERAILMTIVAAADAALAFARQDYGAGAAGVAAAALYAIAAGNAGGGGARGVQGNRPQRLNTSSNQQGAPSYTFNINAPWYGTPGEMSAHLRGVQRAGSGNGMTTGGVV